MNIVTTVQAKKAINECPVIKDLLNKGWHKAGFHEYQNENGEPPYWRVRLDPPYIYPKRKNGLGLFLLTAKNGYYKSRNLSMGKNLCIK